jgi:hypothetical protein
VIRWLVGVVGLGAELHQRPQAARGALLQYFNSSGLGKRAAPGPSAPGAEDLTRMAELRPLIPGGGRRRKAVALPQPTSKPCHMCKKKTLVVHVAR